MDGTLWIGTCNPYSSDLKREIEIVLGSKYQLHFVLATSKSIKEAIRKYYGLGAANLEQMVADTNEDDPEKQKDTVEESKANEASVMKLVNQIITDGNIIIPYKDSCPVIHFMHDVEYLIIFNDQSLFLVAPFLILSVVGTPVTSINAGMGCVMNFIM